MALLTVSEILQPSVRKGWAIGAYDVTDLSMAQGVLDAAEVDDSPVILMIYPAFVPMEKYHIYVSFLKQEIIMRNVTAAIALDHACCIEEAEAGIMAGFTGVMIDSSQEAFEKNVEITKDIVEKAHSKGISVESELGYVGLGSEILTDDELKARYTNVDDAQFYIEQTGVDALAVAIGTAHGPYKFSPQLDFVRLKQLREILDVPLVLHGSSGTPDDQIREAVSLGINKINVYTDIRLAVLNNIENKVKSSKIESYDIPDILNIIRATTSEVVSQKNELFGSVGKGSLYKF